MPRGTPSSASSTLSRASPSRSRHDGGDHEADGGIERQPAVATTTSAATTTPSETAAFGRHVQIGAANIEIAVTTAHEQQRRAAVDDDAECSPPPRRPASTGAGVIEPVDRLDRDAPTATSSRPALNSAARISPAIAVGVPLGRLLLREPRRAPCQQQCCHVGEIVDGVRNQRQRSAA